MPKNKRSYQLPVYRGKKWIRSGLPKKAKPWVKTDRQAVGTDGTNHVAVARALQNSLKHAPWEWPKYPVYFVTDPHADAEAFVASLVASGGIKKTGPANEDFKLTKAGNRGRFIIGGDCLDKGPSNLTMLKSLRALMDSGARVTLLAGNHDLRLLLGLRVLDLNRDPRTEHFFLRMGPKVVPLLKEVYEHYLEGKRHRMRGIPDEQKCRQKLYPSNRWFNEFPKVAEWMMADEAVEREITRMRKKLDLFAARCAEAKLSMRMAYATALKCRELFIQPQGEYCWFFERMQLARREGSFLFIHAGFDDRIAALLAERGLSYVNALYRYQIHHDPFEFYYGPVANTLRTKYRKVNMPLTRHGVAKMHRLGIYAVVHGHRNLNSGQRIMPRHGMLHIESDISMDRNTRAKEGLDGYGVGVTIIRPEGAVLGISTDYPHAKVFSPQDIIKRNGTRSG